MILVEKSHGEHICRIFAEMHRTMPGVWTGITEFDIENLAKGPGDRTTDAGQWQDRMYDSAWAEVCQSAQYLGTDGVTYYLTHDFVGNLVIMPVGTY